MPHLVLANLETKLTKLNYNYNGTGANGPLILALSALLRQLVLHMFFCIETKLTKLNYNYNGTGANLRQLVLHMFFGSSYCI